MIQDINQAIDELRGIENAIQSVREELSEALEEDQEGWGFRQEYINNALNKLDSLYCDLYDEWIKCDNKDFINGIMEQVDSARKELREVQMWEEEE